jgi:hypothetical protein
MDANRRESLGVRPWPEKNNSDREVFGGTSNTAGDPSPLRFDATRTPALHKTDLISEHSRLLAFIRGLMLKFLSFRINLCKSLIFPLFLDIFTCFYWARRAKSRQAPWAGTERSRDPIERSLTANAHPIS